MPYAITQTCCTDASCVAACPVNCIHPTPDEPDYGKTDMLYVDPRTCIDCGACADACPVDAVFPAETLVGGLAEYPRLNADYFADKPVAPRSGPTFHQWGPPRFDRVLPADFPRLDVAVVGTGPAGMYTVQDLLLHTPARVTVYDRLAEPGGLIRYGVAPDHQATKRIGETFARHHVHERVRMRLGVEVGRDVSAEQLRARHDAVVYATGASESRTLGIPGEELTVPATTVVGWYNGHPEVPADALDVSGERVVVVGNGNVALDIARILTADPAALTGVPPAVRARLGAVREVVLLGRRGPESAAYTRPELMAICNRAGVELVVDDADERVGQAVENGVAPLLAGVRRERLDWAAPVPPGRRIVLRFHSAPEKFTGSLLHTGGADIPTDLVVKAIGHRARPLPGLPFDEATGTVPNEAGRVAPGTYVVGWIKRGSTGGIGANRQDAAETVATLLQDVRAATR
ncbi:FAD-dependent oxidoreductase [Pseudonocardia oroxyli]|uniref:ferredoxin--NADP(+) reductase n=1 Tax=Pseudonocardia oroxyli TaxID=366584 RepID=A0A1G7WAV5_PSEOR|nr:FAD-dependent oxidoreductase [Pseudonocardia oroxyli]SDG69133.1 ferredoxin--NADP+ reductase [Pseudonocardia oroxyli]